ncbi:MAG: glycerophosphodiester phosphodiesterase [Clostridia bacterium]|nr:glycerophosphodiester phosphodiesterase [Clostridia bacterium]
MKKTFLILAIVLLALFALYLFLIAPRMSGKPDMSAMMGVHYAHRGFFDNEAGVPENSLPAFTAAIDAGYAIELDVQMSSDGVAMVFHDADLSRMCGVSGKIWDYTKDELQAMKLMGSEETIPTFEEALDLIAGRVPVLVEYKMDKVDTKVCELGHELLKDYDGVYAIQCFHPLALMWYKKNAPHVARGQLSQQFYKQAKYRFDPARYVMTYLLSNVATRPDFISYKYSDAGSVSLNLCRLMGAKTAAWTLRDPSQYDQVKGDFDFYIFDSFAL